MNAPLRRNACPSLAAPMPTGDGLLARLSFVSGGLSPDNLALVAALAERHGNGLLEVTRRGSLQIRGLTAASAERLSADVAAAGLDIRTGTAIDASALSGLDPACAGDPRRLAERLGAALDRQGLSLRLAPKVSVVIDGGGCLTMDEVLADIRLVASANGWTVEVARCDGQSSAGRVLDEAEALGRAVALLRAIAGLGRTARAKNLPDACVSAVLGNVSRNRRPRAAGQPLDTFELRGGRSGVGIALPFGMAPSSSLSALASTARDEGIEEFRFAPGNALIAICRGSNGARKIRDAAERLGFVTDAGDPRRRIAVCAGAPACASGHIDAREVAAKLAAGDAVKNLAGRLHVSGCAKKCAEPSLFAYALVGRRDGAGIEDAGGREIGFVTGEDAAAGFERFLLARGVDADEGGRMRLENGT